MSARTNRALLKQPPGGVAPAAPAAPAPTAAQPAAVPATTPNITAPPAFGLAQPGVAPGVTPPAPAEPPEEIFPATTMQFPAAPVEKILELYSTFSGRTMLRDPALGELKGTVTLIQQTPLTRSEVMQVLEAALAMNKIALVKSGEKVLKVVPSAAAAGAAGQPDARSVTNLNELGTFMTHIVQLKYAKPSEMVAFLTPVFGTPGMPAPVAIDSTYILILRDNEENVKRMLEMIERIDVNVPAEIVSEVIPIKFAKAEDIASALNSVSGGGSSATFGTRGSTGTGSTGGVTGRTGTTGGAYGGRSTQLGAPGQPPTGVPSSQNTFSDRINSIINRAASPGGAGAGDIQLIGANKIIADVRANSLLVFASKQDMATIKEIISKLDIVLAQVMIETIIMDVSLDNNWSLGVSAAQRPQQFQKNAQGTGGFRNGQSFFDFLGSGTTNLTSSLPAGSSYFGQVGVGPIFDIALQAAADDTRINVIQKPRILTSHAKAGSIFLGETRPTVSQTYYGGGFGGSPSSSYQQLEVGIGLDVTPYINTDGLVVMEISQEINEISGTTLLTGVGEVPNTTRRTLKAEVAVKDKETIMLGGFIRDRSSQAKNGVPILKDIPLLGKLFSSSSSKKGRSELVVLMRPTVLRTPAEAAMHTNVEKAHMPIVREAEADLEKRESKKSESERKKTVFKDVSLKDNVTQPAEVAP